MGSKELSFMPALFISAMAIDGPVFDPKLIAMVLEAVRSSKDGKAVGAPQGPAH